MERVRATIPFLLVATLLLGCSGDDGAVGDGDDADRQGRSRPVTEGHTVMSVETPPGSSDDYEGALEDVGDHECRSEGGRWVVEGDVTNTSDVEADYRIYVSFLDDDGDTRGLLEVPVDGVAPGGTTPWDGELALSDDSLSCVLRVERSEAR